MEEAGLSREALGRSVAALGEAGPERASWLPILRRLAEAETLLALARLHCGEVDAETVRAVVAARRMRDQSCWPSTSEAAWTLLLELLASRLEGKRRDLAGLSAATDVPIAAARQLVDWLGGRGVVTRDHGEIELTNSVTDQLRAYLLSALAVPPWLQ